MPISEQASERASGGIVASDFWGNTIHVYFLHCFLLPTLFNATHGIRSYQGIESLSSTFSFARGRTKHLSAWVLLRLEKKVTLSLRP